MIMPWQSMAFVTDTGAAVSKKACSVFMLFSIAGFLPRILKKSEIDRHSTDELKINPAVDEINKREISSLFSQTGVLFDVSLFFSGIASIAPLFSIIGNDYSLRR